MLSTNQYDLNEYSRDILLDLTVMEVSFITALFKEDGMHAKHYIKVKP